MNLLFLCFTNYSCKGIIKCHTGNQNKQTNKQTNDFVKYPYEGTKARYTYIGYK